MNIGIALITNPRVLFLVRLRWRWLSSMYAAALICGMRCARFAFGSMPMCTRVSVDAVAAAQDEPTSGLDSFTANEVMTVVKGLVKDGACI